MERKFYLKNLCEQPCAKVLALVALTPTILLGAANETADSTQNVGAIVQSEEIPKQDQERLVADKPNESTTGPCTTIRVGPDDIMFGTACPNNSEAITVDTKLDFNQNWSYSLVAVGGIYKCGFVRPNILPKLKQPRRGALEHCKKYYGNLVNDRYTILKNINCPELLPGLEGCRDGATGTNPLPTCRNNTLYGNYASDRPSPLNIFGTGDGGFSEPIGKIEPLIKYRAEIKFRSHDFNAAVVRAQKWGLMARHCIRTTKMRGGTVTEFTSKQRNKINQNPVTKEQLRLLENHQEAIRRQKN